MSDLGDYRFTARDVPQHPELQDAVRRLASGGGVDDRDLDRIFPKDVLKLSRMHWTPVAVARRAAALLAPTAGSKLLDVGAGAGKFAFVAALAHAAVVTGVEQHPGLVQ